MRLTPAQTKALRWFVEHGEVHLFPIDTGPSSITRKRLESAGLIEKCGVEKRGIFGLIKYRISPAGLAALRPSPAKTGTAKDEP